MSLFITSLNSGSNGNCYYIGNEREAVLIDAGISCRETEKRMRRVGLKMGMVKAVFISHEHGDHIRGAEGIAAKHKLPVYITAATLHHGRLRVNEQQIKTFKTFKPVRIGELSILAFPKLHDASDPHSFLITGNGVTIGVFTDIGAPCDNVVSHFKQCHAAFLEANYDDVMLESGSYPVYLKNRIRGDHGHLSNLQALELFTKHKPGFMSHLFLSHLSKDNNNPELALKLFKKVAGKTEIVIASRYNETDVYHIQKGLQQVSKKHKAVQQPKQATLF
ncbi:MAG: MBL fold metallo-hydrolase [Chitinophagales bacterium]